MEINEKLVKTIAKEVSEDYSRYKTERDEWDDLYEVADYMYKAAQNRTINSEEKEYGANLPDNDRANVGSTMFFRQVNTLASQLCSVMFYNDDPWHYDPIVNDAIWYSAEDANEMAEQLNVYKRWTLKRNKFKQKAIMFAYQLFKYGNVPIQVFWNKRKLKVKQLQPKYELVTGANGLELAATGTTQKKINAYEEYLDFRVVPWSMLYADPMISEIEDQNCVILLSTVTRSEIKEDVDVNFYSQEGYEKLTDKYEWDGNNGVDFRQKQVENNNMTIDTSETRLYLKWDVFKRIPVNDEGEYDATKPDKLHWLTFIGNDLEDAICMQITDNVGPKGKIPIKMIHAYPDDVDMLYHVSPAHILRSNYSVDCTLKAQAIDNMTMVNNPPMLAVEGMHQVKDFRFKQGAFWPVSSPDAIREFQVRDTTMQTVNLLQWNEEDSMRALATDKPFMGMSFGARTSATEASNIQQNSMQPHMMQVRYILEQMLPWLGQKLKDYMEEYADPEQVVMITDENKLKSVQPSKIYGEFDIEINIVDEYENSQLQMQKFFEFARLVGQSPIFQTSATHTFDAGAFLKAVCKKWKLPEVEKFILPRRGVDASKVAREENMIMMEMGGFDEPQSGEDHAAHLAEHNGEALRWRGIENAAVKARLANLEAHIQKTMFLLEQESGSAGSNLAAPSGNATEGQAVGNQMAAALGAAMGG